MDRGYSCDFSEDRSDLAKTDTVCHDLEVKACRLGRVVENPEIVDTDIRKGYQWNLHITGCMKVSQVYRNRGRKLEN